MILFLLIFYWIFAALFCFGATYNMAKDDKENMFVVFLGTIILGGIFFPMYLGKFICKDYDY